MTLSYPIMGLEELRAFLDAEFPQIHFGGRTYHLEAVGPLSARVRMDYHERHLRPGGTISGPSMMALADLALYAAILGQLGPVALAVTTNLSFNFLRKPAQRALIAECRLLKLGKRLAVGEVSMMSEGEAALVCHATGTYSIPALQTTVS
ncbi:PaaI family thioesterase [Microvirga brassicacearum]|uniref:PaaI family thioesterase n=1 Tax=Microvirga brassicacearum TaxID=2580413 RepID=A0A5N3P8Q3_9HYPH|nr:PaaI family thioesterase [Microvirga brassicacearum]KAB0266097.1 PaaI family thioesterase [Microvirga brassicacearum]